MTNNIEDRFGLPKLSLDQEVAISFTLVVLGLLMVLAVLVPVNQMMSIGPAFLGLIMIVTGYAFAIESIRELEEEDHFLSKKLMKQE